MKKRCILWLLMSVIGLPLIAQNIIYSNLKELLAQNGWNTCQGETPARSIGADGEIRGRGIGT